MNTQTHPSESYPPAGGQTVRLPGSARSASLHEQLYRYADDLQMMIQRNDALAADNDELRQSTDKLLEAREELDAIMHSSLDIHLITDAAGEILQSNPVSATLAPLAALEQGNLRDWIDPASLGSFLAMHANVLQGNHCAEQGHELRLRREDAQRPPLIVMARVLTVRRGDNLRHLHWILRDVTYLRETEFETQIASMVFKNATEGVMITDVEGGILAVNSAFTQITGYDAEEALGRNPHFLASGHQGPEFYEMFWQSLRSKGSWQGQLFNRRRNGETYPERLTVNAVRDSDGRVLSYIGVFSDLSQQRQPSSPGLLDSPLQDPLTRLANRQLLGDRLERMASLSRRAGVPFSLIRIDIDEFGRFNADHGHLVGDRRQGIRHHRPPRCRRFHSACARSRRQRRRRPLLRQIARHAAPTRPDRRAGFAGQSQPRLCRIPRPRRRRPQPARARRPGAAPGKTPGRQPILDLPGHRHDRGT
jgi:PAS domain S-box-containing protein